eukprot:gene40586-38435_t
MIVFTAAGFAVDLIAVVSRAAGDADALRALRASRYTSA